MMLDGRTFAVIGVLALVSCGMRTGDYLAAIPIREDGALARFIQLAPGNLLVAFVVASCFGGGTVSVAGCASALLVMALTGKEWAALDAGSSTDALTAALHL
jgi:hypothetical protein